MNALLAAIALSVASAACYGAGAVAQRRVATLTSAPTPLRTLAALTRRPLWWTSTALNAAGALLHAVALIYGTLIVVQPLGTLILVFALPWSARLAARRVSAREWRGAALTVLALSVMLATAATGDTGHPLSSQGALWLTLAATTAVAALTIAAATTAHTTGRSLLLAAASGVAFGTASALTKAVLEATTHTGIAGLASWAAAGLALMATAGLLLSQAAYTHMDVGAPLATMTLTNPLAAVAAAMVFMGEAYAGGPWGAAVTALAAIAAVRGVILLCLTPHPAPGQTPPPQPTLTPPPPANPPRAASQ